jgi:hypothetical protein
MDWLKGFNPVTITEALRAVLPVLVLFNIINWTPEQIAGALMAVSAVLAVFVRGTTISTAKLDQRVEERVAAVDAGVRGAGGADGPNVPGTGSGYDKLRSLLVVGVVSFAMALSACASSQKQKVVVAYQSAEVALGQFQDTEIRLYEGKKVPSLTEEKHKAIHANLSKLFDLQDKVGGALLIWRTGEPVPQTVRAYFDEAERVIGELRKELPDNDRLMIIQAALPWIRALVDMARLLKTPVPALEQVATEGGF